MATMSQLLRLLNVFVQGIIGLIVSDTGLARIVSFGGQPSSGFYIPLVALFWLIPCVFFIIGIFRRLLRKD